MLSQSNMSSANPESETPTPPLAEIERSNVRHLVMDIAWFGLALAATTRFLSVYAIRLGATPLDLGMITALPALILMISAATGSAWMRRFGSASRALILPAFFFRLVFLLPAFAPFLPLHLQPAWLIFSVSLPALVQGSSATAFVTVMRSAVQDNGIPKILSKRSTVMNITIAIGALAFGFLLERAPFPLGYQLMFVLAFVFALISYSHCIRIDCRVNDRFSPSRRATAVEGDNKTRTAVSVMDAWRSPRFRQVALVVMITHIAFFSIVPVTPLHIITKFGAAEGFMAVFAMVELAGGALIGLIAPRVASKVGTRAMIAVSMLGTALAGVVFALAPSLPITLIGAALSGASWTAVAMIGLFAYFTENTPSDQVPAYSSAYHQVIGLATFIGPLIGSTLANSGINLVVVLLIGAGMRLIAAPLLEHHLKDRIKEVSVASFNHVKLAYIRRSH
jgi:MFS family permease